MSYSRSIACAYIVLFSAACIVAVPTADAQIWNTVKKAAKQTVESEAQKKTKETVRSALGLAEDVVVCMADDTECAEDAEKNGQEYVVADNDGNVVEDHRRPAETKEPVVEEKQAPVKPGEGVWANYDFVPGERVIFADDFEADRVGDFPRRLEFLRGNMEVVEWEGQRLLRATSASQFGIPLPETLPDKFTIEFDFHQPAGHLCTFLYTAPYEGNRNRLDASYFQVCSTAGVKGPRESTMQTWKTRDALTPVRIHVDGKYVKMYLGEMRVSNLPSAELRRSDMVVVDFVGRQRQPGYLGNLRIAAGGGDLYDALKEQGRVATRGILFDTGSDLIRPESTPTLDEIGRMLSSHADLRISIEGHTDSVGDDDYNLNLSHRRAQSVLNYLIEDVGISEDRLEAVGHGETKPVDTNDSPEGRQNNRRVELVDISA